MSLHALALLHQWMTLWLSSYPVHKPNLWVVRCSDCTDLRRISNLPTGLQGLSLLSCYELKSIGDLSQLSHLRELNTDGAWVQHVF